MPPEGGGGRTCPNGKNIVLYTGKRQGVGVREKGGGDRNPRKMASTWRGQEDSDCLENNLARKEGGISTGVFKEFRETYGTAR